MANSLPEEAPLRRLHPSTLVQRFVQSLPGFVLLLIPIFRGTDDGMGRFSLTLLFIFGVLTLPSLVAGYYFFRYRLSARELFIESGVFSRQKRSIPLERIQRVEVDQPLIPRLFGTARVQLMTGSGMGAEGTLEFISLKEAEILREAVRAVRQSREETPPPTSGVASVEPTSTTPHADAEVRFALSRLELLRTGAMRFSLVYIAIAFSALQFTGMQVEDVVYWIERGSYLKYVPYLDASPAVAVGLTVIVAIALSWLAGILQTIIQFNGFILRDDGEKFYTTRGLAGRYDRSIPRTKIQALVFSSNPIMRAFGYQRLDAVTMGLNDEGSGRETLIPMAPVRILHAFASQYLGATPHAELHPVSRVFIRRRQIQYSALLSLPVAATIWLSWHALWGLALLPFLWLLAYRQWLAHGFVVEETRLIVQYGAIWRSQWSVPISKVQSLDLYASWFQRRKQVASVAVDLAGGMEVGGSTIHDLPIVKAGAVKQVLHFWFDTHFTRLEAARLRRIAEDEAAEEQHHRDRLPEGGPLEVEQREPKPTDPSRGDDPARPPREAGDHGPEQGVADPLPEETREGTQQDPTNEVVNEQILDAREQEGDGERRTRPPE